MGKNAENCFTSFKTFQLMKNNQSVIKFLLFAKMYFNFFKYVITIRIGSGTL
jgi:hypothetical protein